MNGSRLVVPGVFELMTAIGGEEDFDTELLRGLAKAACLVTKLAGEDKESAGESSSMTNVHTKDSACAIVSFAFAMGTNWSSVGSAQQYQGSFKYGMAARATIGSNGGKDFSGISAASAAALLIFANDALRGRFTFSAAATISLIS